MTPSVIGAVIDLGFCLDLITDNGISVVEKAYSDLTEALNRISTPMPANKGGDDLRMRYLDCRVMNYLNQTRAEDPNLDEFDTIKGVFTEGDPIYPNAGFRKKTHMQICVRKESMIKAVFRVKPEQFSDHLTTNIDEMYPEA